MTSRRRSRVVAVLAAVLVPVAIWVLAVPVLNARLLVEDREGAPFEIGLPPVLVVSLAVALAGWGLLALLERLTRRARTVWTVIAVAVLVLSFVPLTGPGTSAVTRMVLGSMHLAVAAVLIPVLSRTSRPS